MHTRSTSAITAARLAAALLAVCGMAHAALGQNALDRNLQAGSGGVNPSGRDFAAEVRFRNGLITGNAPNGMSFRGNVGYRAPGEFAGRLGSDSSFLFRRDSVNSGLGGMGIRGTDALQYQMALTTGNKPPPNVIGVPVYGRTGIGATSGSLGPSGSALRAEAIAGQDQLRDLKPTKPVAPDTRGLSLQAVRSTSSYMANRGLEPLVVGYTRQEGAYKTVTSSVLRGISYDDLSGFDRSKLEAAEAKPLSPDAQPSTSLNTPAAPEKPLQKLPSGVEPIRTSYDDMVDRLKSMTPGAESTPNSAAELLKRGNDPAKPEKAQTPEWQRRVDELRAQLAAAQKKAEEAKKTAPEAGAPDQSKPEEGNDKSKDGKDGKQSEEDSKDPDKSRDSQFDAKTLGMVRDAGGDIRTLAPPAFDAYSLQMQAGQQHLASGRYFDAEERFAAALSAKSGDPMAAIGRIHAEIGAGMYLSAAINLRALFLDHPEITAAKYGPELLPAKDRTQVTFERLTQLSGEGDGRGRDPALLLAYFGYQMGNVKAMNMGLERMVAGAPTDRADQLTRLATLLREVWTKPAQPAPEQPPATTPTTPAPEK